MVSFIQFKQDLRESRGDVNVSPDWESQMSKTENRKSGRVEFSNSITVQMVAIDGTWRRECTMLDVGATGAKLIVDQPLDGLNLKEFFLVLSATGLAFRRCELAWLNGNQLGIRFLETKQPKKSLKKAKPPP